MKQWPFYVVISLALIAPAAYAKTVVVTEAQNGRAVTLFAGDTLVVRLMSQTGLGATEWHVVYNPESLLKLTGPPHAVYPVHPHGVLVIGNGKPIPQEFWFTVPQSKGSFTKGAWLRFLPLSDFEPNIKGAKLWQIQYTVKASH